MPPLKGLELNPLRGFPPKLYPATCTYISWVIMCQMVHQYLKQVENVVFFLVGYITPFLSKDQGLVNKGEKGTGYSISFSNKDFLRNKFKH